MSTVDYKDYEQLERIHVRYCGARSEHEDYDQVRRCLLALASLLREQKTPLFTRAGIEDIANAQPVPMDNEPLESQIDRLAKVLIEEFGGPVASEGAVDAAIRFLRAYKMLTGIVASPEHLSQKGGR